jgi:hypothetical protein
MNETEMLEPQPKVKKEWTKPELIVHGTVEDITQDHSTIIGPPIRTFS